mgnify:CR=1 FL=1
MGIMYRQLVVLFGISELRIRFFTCSRGVPGSRQGRGGNDSMTSVDPKYGAYISILKEELIPAMGCTEPIALAYGAAKAREVLGAMPDKVCIGASGSIIKNVKSVIVPNTDKMKGIPAAAVAGIVAGDAAKELEVIASVSKEQIAEMRAFLKEVPITVEHVDNGLTFDIIVTVYRGTESAQVRIVNYHTNIVHIEKNGEVSCLIINYNSSSHTLLLHCF